jgi:hypothetical protein
MVVSALVATHNSAHKAVLQYFGEKLGVDEKWFEFLEKLEDNIAVRFLCAIHKFQELLDRIPKPGSAK